MKQCLYFILIVCLSSCLRLDDFLYAPETIDGDYKLNNISPEDLDIPSSFLVDEDLITELLLPSKNEEGGNETIYAYYLGDTSRIFQDTVILYCHGNAYHIDGYWQRVTLLANVGSKNRYGVLIMDYQGYGKSTGKPYEEGLYKDVNACINWLADKGLIGNRLVLYGFSMGSAPATELTANPRNLIPSKLILEAPFASGGMLVNDATPLNLPGSYATSLEIDNAEEIKKINQPFMWLHGEKDDFLSRRYHGQVIYDNYKGIYSHKVITPEGTHSNVPFAIGIDTYLLEILAFIEN